MATGRVLLLILFSVSNVDLFPLPLSRAISNNLECNICKLAIAFIQDAVATNKTFQEIYPTILEGCVDILNSRHMYGEYMCPGLVMDYGPVVQNVGSHILLEPVLVCETLRFCFPSHLTLEEEDSASDVGKLAQLGVNVARSDLPSSPEGLHKSRASGSARVADAVAGSRQAGAGGRQAGAGSRQAVAGSRQAGAGGRQGGAGSRQARPGSREAGAGSRHAVAGSRQAGGGSRQAGGGSRQAGKIITFVQLADIHMDPDYAEGSPTDCGLFMCCRSWYNGTGSAGYYGAYECDVPRVTVDLVMEKILSLDPTPQFIIYTGDNAPHDPWNESVSTQNAATERVVGYLKEKLSSLQVPIFPAIGNHESWPQSEYTGTLEIYKELTQYLSEVWEKLVRLSPEARSSVAEGGYYSLLAMEGLRIISFNTDYGYGANVYALLNSMNPHYHQQWAWLAKALQQAESNGEKVLLIGHVPPGDYNNNGDFGERYLNLTKRFKDVIIGHLFGHTHMDQFQLVQDSEGVHGVVLVSPSITTYPRVNPSFRTFTLNLDNHLLLNYTQHFLNLSRANALHKEGRDGEVQFEVSYTSTGEYSLKDLSPDSFFRLSERFSSDDKLLNKYKYNTRVKSDEADRTCNSKCGKDLMCDLRNIISTNALMCRLN